MKKIIGLTCFFLVVIASFCSVLVFGFASMLYAGPLIHPATGTLQWSKKADMPTARRLFATGVVNGKIYAMGGIDGVTGTTPTRVVEEYDPTTNAWRTRSPMPTPRGGCSAATVNGKVYVIGGYTGSISSLSTVEVYDPATDTWAHVTYMHALKCNAGTIAVNNKIYVFGGMTAATGGTIPTVEVYDTLTDSWTIAVNMPTGRAQLALALVGNKIYTIGGYIGGGDEGRTLEVYDIPTNSWTIKSDMPHDRISFGAAVVGGKIYAVGGQTIDATSLDGRDYRVDVYDPSTDVWSPETNMSVGRSGHCVVMVNDKMYAIGGVPYGTGTMIKTVEEGVVSSIPCLPVPTPGTVVPTPVLPPAVVPVPAPVDPVPPPVIAPVPVVTVPVVVPSTATTVAISPSTSTTVTPVILIAVAPSLPIPSNTITTPIVVHSTPTVSVIVASTTASVPLVAVSTGTTATDKDKPKIVKDDNGSKTNNDSKDDYLLIQPTTTVKDDHGTKDNNDSKDRKSAPATAKNFIGFHVYPNPVDFTTAVRGTLKFSGLPANTTIRIFNVTGGLVSTLSNGNTDMVEWSGRNDDGEAIGMGVYIYLLTDVSGDKKSGKIGVSR
jgi:N-acetylneuraminic acid mutarotase